jgi:hypothetical protein
MTSIFQRTSLVSSSKYQVSSCYVLLIHYSFFILRVVIATKEATRGVCACPENKDETPFSHGGYTWDRLGSNGINLDRFGSFGIKRDQMGSFGIKRDRFKSYLHHCQPLGLLRKQIITSYFKETSLVESKKYKAGLMAQSDG